MTTPATDNPHITEVRRIMMEQLRALRSADKNNIDNELARSKAVSELSQTLINSAKVEIEYLRETGQEQSKFLELPPEVHTGNTPGITRNSADTIKPKRNWVGLPE